jgi:hypothetical protein
MPKLTLSKSLVWAGILLILITGLIHLVDAPDSYEEVAYKGVLFYLNGAGALLAAVGIYRGARGWGWSLGALIAFGSIVGYILSRTVGLPMLEVEDEWLEPLGVIALAVEALFMALYLYVITRPVEVRAPAQGPAITRPQSASSR